VLTVTAPPAGLVAAYDFNEGSGTTVHDASGNDNTGAIGTATWTSAGKFGPALLFNGTSARVTINDANSLDLTTGMTLEAWVYPTAGGGWRDVVYKGPDDIYYLMGSSDNGRPAIGGIFSPTAARASTSLPLNTWTHLAGTYDGATLRLYADGAQVGSQAQTALIPVSTGALTIGGDALYGQYFAGRIDEVRIYNRALSATEIQTDMNTSVGGVFTPTNLSTSSLVILGQDESGYVIMRVDGVPGSQYEIQASEDLIDWTPVGVVSAETGVGFFTDLDATTHGRRFYRVLENP
jgi:hypothetical protein